MYQMDKELEKQLFAIVDETRKKNEREGFENIIKNVFNFGLSQGGKMHASQISKNMLMSLVNDETKTPSIDGWFCSAMSSRKNSNKVKVGMSKYENGKWDWETDTAKKSEDEDFYWIDVNVMFALKINNLRNE